MKTGIGMIKFKLSAVIPVAQYSNLQPEFEVEADTYEEALAIAEAQMIPFWNKYVESGKELKTAQGTLIEGFVGGSVYYDPLAHVYTNEAGEVYLSSTQHAEKFVKPFDKQKIAEATAKKHGVSADEVIGMWDLKGKISRDLGTSIHEAIELRRRYEGLSKALGNEGNIHLSPLVKKPVDELMKLLPRGKEALEAVVIDHPNKQVGRIDLIRITGDKECEVIDFKTGEMKEHYWKQTEFTSNILERNDWKVKKMKIIHYDGGWHVYEKEFKF